MVWLFVFGILALVFIAVIVIGFTKFLIKTAVKAALVFAIIILISSAILYIDRRSFEQNFETQENLYVIHKNATIVNSYEGQGWEYEETEIEFSEDYAQVLGSRYRMLLFSSNFQETMGEESYKALYREVGRGNINVYPNSPFFVGLKVLPFLAYF